MSYFTKCLDVRGFGFLESFLYIVSLLTQKWGRATLSSFVLKCQEDKGLKSLNDLKGPVHFCELNKSTESWRVIVYH